MTLSPNESVWLPEIGFFIILQQGLASYCSPCGAMCYFEKSIAFNAQNWLAT
ncbi:hypothetical protein V8G57_00750 [Collimonas sp. H4R21]|uniref:Uncharacterized protein n=1 Tax=Collimonas rhizosphaerae TaxID=3126357 RepID=A0ABU9PPI3_9BURK|nr:hypothetical protein [Collimonas sp. OK412]